ncbi:uncharacterized protein LOC100879463 isoform X4 [Megachile rotundata]|uniref:uncharacterized protein LOC100879463 isoform X4 n=1 Tax=Megachile rotundata TaxID=143995 RepID=UPI003FD33FF3
MGSSGQLYSLSWGEFSSSLASAVQLLRGHGDLVDVTLAAGGRSFPAHKIVLCAASPFLLDLLKSTPCQHPVVMLAGIGADDLESLLEFVYRGEVSVEPSQLPSLLQAAHCLCIHGLTPPTILTENGEEVPISAIPTANEALSKETHNPYFPLKRKKKRRKSSSSSGKWPRTSNTTDSENRPVDGSDNRSSGYDHKDEDNTEHGDDTGSLMGSASIPGAGDQGASSALAAATSCTASIASATNGIYSSDGNSNMLSCLLPSLPTLPSLSSPHDVFRHSEMLRADIAYHDSSRHHHKQTHRSDVT